METAMTLSVDDLERLEHLLDIVVAMHDLFGIRLEEAAGRCDQYVHENMHFVKGTMFWHEEAEMMALGLTNGKSLGKTHCFGLARQSGRETVTTR